MPCATAAAKPNILFVLADPWLLFDNQADLRQLHNSMHGWMPS